MKNMQNKYRRIYNKIFFKYMKRREKKKREIIMFKVPSENTMICTS
jgi:hypothetical protein